MNAPARKPVAETRPAMRWPVTDDPFTMRPIKWFDTWGEAVDCVNANLGKRNLYVGEPRYAPKPMSDLRRDTKGEWA